jgi:hypothetical protein
MTPQFRDYDATPDPKQSNHAPLRLWLIAIFILAIGCLALAVKAVAHEAVSGFVYPASCCWGPSAGRTGDCGEIPNASVREGPNGYELSLVPGDHPKVNAPLKLTVPYGKEQISPDSKYHVCLAPDLSPRCFFAGAHGS